MTALLVVAAVLLLTVALTKQRRPERIGFIERTARGYDPFPEPQPWQRRNRWLALYGRLSVEQQMAGTWPFPPPSAVHSLPRGQQTDPAQLLAQ
jgi:hypothetical protein